jgi:hypothetical protein
MELTKVNRYIKSSALTPLLGFDLSNSPTFDVNPSKFTTKKQQSKAKEQKFVCSRWCMLERERHRCLLNLYNESKHPYHQTTPLVVIICYITFYLSNTSF